MSMLRNVLALAGLIGGLWSGAASATVWNFETDFTANPALQVGNGPANAWFYFYAAPDDHDGIYTLFTKGGSANSLTGYVHENNGFHLALPGLVHPGNSPSDAEPDVIVGFRAPSAGSYAVSGLFRDNDGSDFNGPLNARGVQTFITTTETPGVADSDAVIPQFAPALLDASNSNGAMRALLGGIATLPVEAAFDFTISLLADQYLFFRVNDYGSYLFDSTSLAILIDDGLSVPAPAALPPFALGIAVLLAARRRPRRSIR